jgi:hypothetical protein
VRLDVLHLPVPRIVPGASQSPPNSPFPRSGRCSSSAIASPYGLLCLHRRVLRLPGEIPCLPTLLPFVFLFSSVLPALTAVAIFRRCSPPANSGETLVSAPLSSGSPQRGVSFSPPRASRRNLCRQGRARPGAPARQRAPRLPSTPTPSQPPPASPSLPTSPRTSQGELLTVAPSFPLNRREFLVAGVDLTSSRARRWPPPFLQFRQKQTGNSSSFASSAPRGVQRGFGPHKSASEARPPPVRKPRPQSRSALLHQGPCKF